jgi:putative transposon-encoded protein
MDLTVSTLYILPLMDRHEIEGHEVIEGTVKPTGNGAHIYVPKEWVGADVKIVRTTDPDPNTD